MAEILIADDSEFERKKMTEMLEREDHEVIEASNGKTAVKKYKKNDPDLVLLDIIMDKMNGIDALENIIDYDGDAKVIMVSGVGHEDTIVKALDMGANRYVIKPIDRTKIIPTVKKVLGG